MEFKIKPWQHQLEIIERAAFRPWFALFLEMGTGKSATTINILRSKALQSGRFLKTLVFCPPLVIPNWKEEFLRHSEIQARGIIPLYGPQVRRAKLFREMAPSASIFITNYEALSMKDLFQEMLEWEAEAIVFDECHRLKNHTAQRSKLAYEIANPMDLRAKARKKKPLCYMLSGTPILNNPMDIFQQFKIMDGGNAFGQNYFGFRAKYFRDRNASMPKDRYFPQWEIRTLQKDGFDATSDINKKIFENGARVEKKDCLDLPPELNQMVKVPMSMEQGKLYHEMKRDFVTYYKSGACTATMGLTKLLRLMQITSGFISTGEGEEKVLHELKNTPKREALKELLSEITEQGHKVLVWAVWTHNYAEIRSVCEELGLKFVEVHGGISDRDKRENVERFKLEPDRSVFIGHPGSGGIGINLVNAAYSIFYSRTFALADYLQAKARNHRGGSKEAGHDKITHYDLVVENTIDELAVRRLLSKLDMSEQILADIAGE